MVLGHFKLSVPSSDQIPRMLDEGVRRMDAIYTHALDSGVLSPDPSLVNIEPEVQQQIEEAPLDLSLPEETAPVPGVQATPFNVQVETPDPNSVQQAEVAVSRVDGVTSAITTSLALGGTSVMRVTFTGDAASLQAALQRQGWQVQ